MAKVARSLCFACSRSAPPRRRRAIDNLTNKSIALSDADGFGSPKVPVDNLSALSIGQDYFLEKYDLRRCVVCSPDAGGV